MSYDRKMGKDRDEIYDLKQNIFNLDKAKRSAASKKGAMYKKGAVGHKESEELATMPGSFKNMDTKAVGKKMDGSGLMMKGSWMSQFATPFQKQGYNDRDDEMISGKIGKKGSNISNKDRRDESLGDYGKRK